MSDATTVVDLGVGNLGNVVRDQGRIGYIGYEGPSSR